MGEIKDFASGVEYIARQVAENTPRDITQKGRITAIVGAGLYSVLINGKVYTSVPTNPIGITTLAVNDTVWCMAPQGNYALMFILTGGSGETPTPETTDYNALSNKPSINSVVLQGNQSLSALGIQASGNYVVDADYVHTDNNFTNADSTKLQGIETGAEVNIIETVQINGSALTPSNKIVNVIVPTKTSDITNDSAFQTATQVTSSISTHNTSTSAHGDIRTLVSNEVSNRQTADNNLQAQITSNDTDITNLQNNKANVADIPTKTSDLTNDSGFITSIPTEYVTETEMQAYAQPIGSYATDTELSQGLATKLSLSGGTMTGNINMGNFAITNLADATANQSPATFKQLNDAISGLGTVFDLKGAVATIADLPAAGNVIGDVWYVESESVGYIWLQDTTGTLRWEKFGEEIDLSGYLTKAGLLTTVGSATDNTMTQAAITTALGTKANTADLADVAMSGLYSDLTGTPISLPASDVYSWAKQPTKPSYTASEVGLGNVPNVNTNNQTPTWTIASALANLVSGEALSIAFGKIAKAIQSLISHIANVSNPHSVTKTQVGLGNVDNTADINKPISTATQNALNLKVDTADLSDVAFSGLYSDLTGTPTIPTKTSQLTNDSNFAQTNEANIFTQPQTVGGTKISQGSATVIGVTKNTTVFNGNQAIFSQGAVFSGTAQNAGLVTRGVCGVTTPDISGNCEKADLYLNYDGNNNYARKVYLGGTGDGSMAVRKDMLPTSLPANGGNADTVGNKTPSDLQNYNNLTNKPTIPVNSDFTLSGLGDTIIATPSNSQILQYNGTKWVNANPQSFSQQQANWNETSTSSVQYIQNKPVNATQSVSGFMSNIDKTKLDGIQAGAQVNTVTGVKGNSETTYRVGNVNITATNIGLGNVNNTSDVNKPISSATRTALNLKANISSPALTGTPTAPTATAGTSTTQIATTSFVANAVSQVGGTTIIVSATQPASPKDGDLWYQII